MIVNDIAAEERRALVGRILAWQGLRRAEKLCRLLQLLDENATESPLSEKEIAARLFPRPASHDTADDSIVRVSVRQLRFKLQEYFAGPGADERWTIEIPKGEYALRFAERTPALPAAEIPLPSVESTIPTRRKWWLGVAGALAGGFATGYWTGHRSDTAVHDLPRNLLVRATDNGKYSLTVVPGDIGLRQLVFLPGGKEPSLSEYLSPPASETEIAADDESAGLKRWILNNRLVSGPHTAVVGSLMASTGELRTRTAVRHPRDITVRALQQNSHAFLASRLMNPVVNLFEPKLTLRCDNETPSRRIRIVDTAARGGEPAEYAAAEARDGQSYARIALLPNLGSDGGRVLLLSGLGAVGTESAALVASDPAWLKVIEERLPAGQIYFEALVEARAANGMPVDLNVRIVRPIRADASKH